ncbi:MAG: YraN family protein [Lachnospiraceae bacterium]|nr:YraN family protein [Lachnospiraceae bacterium]
MNKRKTGARYEEQAACFLEARGYRILERNFYCRQGEIDLVAEESGYLVFIEVKYRKSFRIGYPSEAVDGYKQRKLSRAAAYYCHKNRIPETRACRFDVVSILGEQVELIQNAFLYVW